MLKATVTRTSLYSNVRLSAAAAILIILQKAIHIMQSQISHMIDFSSSQISTNKIKLTYECLT